MKLHSGRDQVDLGDGATSSTVYPDGMRDTVDCGTDGGTVYLVGGRDSNDEFIHCGVAIYED